MLELKGKPALVIGTKRIGQVVAARLSMEGVNLAIGYRKSKAEAHALYKAVSSKVERACLVQGDVAVEEDAKRMVSQTAEKLGGLFFLINLASEFSWTPFNKLNSSSWERAMSEAKGSYLLAVHAARVMRKNQAPTRGHILFFSDSAAGATPYRGYLPYLTAKAAIQFMTRAFAVELAKYNILVNAIAPGPTMRPPDIKEEAWERSVIGKTPLKRESSPEDIAELIVALLKSETITGESIRVDSGSHLVGS